MANEGVAAVDRALSILAVFIGSRGSKSLADLAKATGLYKSTILRLCESLEKANYLVRDSSRQFRLGPGALALGSCYQESFDLSDIVKPALKKLSEDTGESSSFYIREDDKRICLFRVNSTQHQILHFLHEGTTFPLHTGATGKIFQAFLLKPQDEAYDAIRKNMSATSLQHRTISETGAIAVPIFSADEGLAGVMSLAGPINRFHPEALRSLTEALLTTAITVSKAMAGKTKALEAALLALQK